jgi:tellurite resistance protein TerC
VAKFYYLKVALSTILVFVGTKMVVADIYKVPIAASLGIIVAILTVAVLASALRARAKRKSQHPMEQEPRLILVQEDAND